MFIAVTPGSLHEEARSVEDIAEQWATINDESGYSVPAELNDWAATFMAHLFPKGDDPAVAARAR